MTLLLAVDVPAVQAQLAVIRSLPPLNQDVFLAQANAVFAAGSDAWRFATVLAPLQPTFYAKLFLPEADASYGVLVAERTIDAAPPSRLVKLEGDAVPSLSRLALVSGGKVYDYDWHPREDWPFHLLYATEAPLDEATGLTQISDFHMDLGERLDRQIVDVFKRVEIAEIRRPGHRRGNHPSLHDVKAALLDAISKLGITFIGQVAFRSLSDFVRGETTIARYQRTILAHVMKANGLLFEMELGWWFDHQFPERFHLSLVELRLPPYLHPPLKRAGLHTGGDIARQSRDELLRILGSPRYLGEVIECLALFGLRPGMASA